MRDGLRHTKQNYEKLAGVKRSKSKAAAARRLVVSAKGRPATKRLLPLQPDQVASKGGKPVVQKKAPVQAAPAPEAAQQEPKRAAAAADAVPLPKAWKGLPAVRGRSSSRGGHLRQGSASRRIAQPAGNSTRAAEAVNPTIAGLQPVKDSTTADKGEASGSASQRQTGFPGVERVLRPAEQPRRSARVEYVLTCRRHGAFRHDRVPRMVDFFAQHSVAGCR